MTKDAQKSALTMEPEASYVSIMTNELAGFY